jgi:Protein of unknown function (DUF2917)
MTASRIHVPLERAQLLRIWHGQGTRVKARSGMLWLSEEGSLADHVLRRGDSMTLHHGGKALVLAVDSSRVIVEIPGEALPPRALEVAPAEGQPGRPIRLGALESVPGGRLVAIVAGFFRRSLDGLCSLLLHQRSSRDTH